ncbi:MAG: hypothetical protein RIC55_12505 [Pirellulaceae bacterium]
MRQLQRRRVCSGSSRTLNTAYDAADRRVQRYSLKPDDSVAKGVGYVDDDVDHRTSMLDGAGVRPDNLQE